MSLIWITHDLGVVANVADRVLVMYGGTIVEEAQVDLLIRKPAASLYHGAFSCPAQSQRTPRQTA
jgi:peptide/nickel transport system ATP-binding protein